MEIQKLYFRICIGGGWSNNNIKRTDNISLSLKIFNE